MIKVIILMCLSLELVSVAANERSSNNKTIGHKILYLESEVTGVAPNISELDEILYKIVAKIKDSKALRLENEETKAQRVFQIISKTLKTNNYSYRGTNPTSLTEVFTSDEKSFDCDTGSFIYLSVADLLSLPMSMVEVEVGGNPEEREYSDHNFVRWKLKNGTQVDWDVNDENLRHGDTKTKQFGFGWNDDQLLGYIYFLRGVQWKKRHSFSNAIHDYRLSIKSFPEWAKVKNNLAWLYSTVEELQSKNSKREALELALTAVEMHSSVNNRDTLACAYAINGDFVKAIEVQSKVVDDYDSISYRARLKKLRDNINCLGEA